jgi:hypothetical protein
VSVPCVPSFGWRQFVGPTRPRLTFAARCQVREKAQAARLLLVTIALDPARHAEDVRAEELLDRLPSLRTRGAASLPQRVTSLGRLGRAGESYGRKPVGFSR